MGIRIIATHTYMYALFADVIEQLVELIYFGKTVPFAYEQQMGILSSEYYKS